MPSTEASRIICTVDVVLLTLHQESLHVLLLKREQEPFEGALALPGGYIHASEDLSAEQAAARVLHAKTGMASPYLEQLATFSGPGRDPRGWSVSIAHYALVPQAMLATRETSVRLLPVERLPALPFDHHSIVELAVGRGRGHSPE
jgi:8-oxo-dGTP diphosphatase